jgi:hypothetical protein
MIAPPEYKVEVVTLDKNGATDRLNEAIKIVEKEIRARGGLYKLKTPPTRIGATRDGVEAEDIIANLQDDNQSDQSGNESNDSGIDVDLDGDDGIQVAEEEEEKK